MDHLFLNTSLTRTLSAHLSAHFVLAACPPVALMALADPGSLAEWTPVSCHHATARPQPCAEVLTCMPSFLQGHKGMNLAVCGLAPTTVTMLCQDTEERPRHVLGRGRLILGHNV